MNSQPPLHIDTLQNRLGLRMAARLSAGTNALPHDITERLRAARQQALARRRQPAAAARLAPAAARGAPAHLREDGLGFWGRIASAALVVAMVAGLVTIHSVQGGGRATEVADVDAALLTDDLPPAAYADPGFLQYLQTSANRH
ncbi:MAG: DUF3619 family protein [Pseudomonadota bacterium]|nr:DUF3619 family protein [Pseudomonadota bacterium]